MAAASAESIECELGVPLTPARFMWAGDEGSELVV